MKTFTTALTIVLVFIFLNGLGLRKRVEAQILVKRYLHRQTWFWEGTNKSIIILLKGSSNARIGCKCAFGIVW